MSKRLQYKNFKKVHEDANSATLQHPEGHTIKIAKGPLSDHIKKQLGALPFCDGGEAKGYKDGGVADVDNPDSPSYQAATKDENGHWVPKQQPRQTHRINAVTGDADKYKSEAPEGASTGVVSTPTPPSNNRGIPEAATNALGIQQKANGGEISGPPRSQQQQQYDKQQQQINESRMHSPNMQYKANAGQIQHYAEGTPPGETVPNMSMPNSEQQPQQQDAGQQITDQLANQPAPQ